MWRCGRIGGASGSITTGKGRFFDWSGGMWSRGGNPLPFGDQETVGCDAQCAVMMESPPATALIMAEADFLLEVTVIMLDTPAQLGEIDEPAQRHVRVDGCEPVFDRLVLALGPLDEQRLFGETCFAPDRRNAHAHTGKARPQLLIGAFPPRDSAPGALGQAEGQCYDADTRRLRIVLAHWAHFGGRQNGGHIGEA